MFSSATQLVIILPAVLLWRRYLTIQLHILERDRGLPYRCCFAASWRHSPHKTALQHLNTADEEYVRITIKAGVSFGLVDRRKC